MKPFLFFWTAASFLTACGKAVSTPPGKIEGSVHDFEAETIDGKKVKLSDYRGKVLLIVNVASKCGYTPQYAQLQALYEKRRADGFEILAFPANDFLNQEPGSNAEIKQFCSTNYGVTFPLFAKISVKGDDIHPLYRFLTESTGEKVKWNFQKYLIDREGKPVAVFTPAVKVTDKEFLEKFEPLMAQK
ncbi:MAG: glutathione peroxidase [Bacteroidia bacterium]|nr:glutathione peroxidase [Bacteroidia bacterium]MDW8332983.1 glutathione peroxidase [Bacteroidia bacterium]